MRQAVAMVMGTVVCQGWKTVWTCSRELMVQTGFTGLRVSQFSVLEIVSVAVMVGFHHCDHHGNNDIKANTKKTEGISHFSYLCIERKHNSKHKCKLEVYLQAVTTRVQQRSESYIRVEAEHLDLTYRTYSVKQSWDMKLRRIY